MKNEDQIQFMVDPFTGKVAVFIPAPIVVFEDVAEYQDFVDMMQGALEKFNKAIDEETQRQGCDDHIWLPALVNLPIESKGEDDITYMKGGKSITNAPKNKTGMNVFTSTEMRELSKSYYDPELIKKLLRFREEFGVDTRLEELTRDG